MVFKVITVEKIKQNAVKYYQDKRVYAKELMDNVN